MSPIGDYGKVTMSNTIMPNNVGYFPQAIAQPERAGSFGEPFTDLAFAFLTGWKSEEPLGVVAIGDDYVTDSAQLCKDGYDAMREALRLTKSVPWRVKESTESANVGATLAEEGKVEWETIAGSEALDKIDSLLKKYPYKPTHRVYMGFRRSFQLLLAWARFVDNGGDAKDFKIPIVAKKFVNGDDETLSRWRENTDKHYSRQYSLAGFVAIAVKGMATFRWTESKMQLALNLKRGLAQQVYAWAILHREYGKLDILRRLLLPVPAKDEKTKRIPYTPNGYIPSAISAGDLRGLLGLSDGEKNLPDNVLAAYKVANVNPSKTGKRWDNAPQNVVETFFKMSLDGITKAPRSVTKDLVESLASDFPAENPLNGFLKQLSTGNDEGIKATLPKVKQAFEELEMLRAKIVELTTERDAIAQERDELKLQITPKATRKGSKAKVS